MSECGDPSLLEKLENQANSALGLALGPIVGCLRRAFESGRAIGSREAMARHLCPMSIGPALDQSLKEAMETAAREEREACAVIVEMADLFWHDGDPRKRMAAAIRARGEVKP